ncbi:MAG TPA: aminodeoxychorismate synthase component I [Flavobacteriales bacterium]|nr:aminodeoxychorismate synthase component I [Flavobacteriales bacterium]|tara:strand:+ start:1421 stop:2707 length:1287 start_codon:yes stop_codon:yes gene_type:complete
MAAPEMRSLPHLKTIFDRETHASLYFDSHRTGTCYLALGARRSLTWDGTNSKSLEALQSFLHPNGQGIWAFGWIGYDLKNGIENLHSLRPDPIGLPTMHWVQPRLVIAWGGGKSQYEIVFGQNEPDAHATLQLLNETSEAQTNPLPPAPGISLKPRWDESTYLQKATRVKKHIQQGDIYEMNLCQEWSADEELASPWDAFVRLHHFTQPPYAALVKAGEFHVICGSPELFLKRRGDQLISSPIKGTIRRGRTPEEDDLLAQQLQNDPKERGENVMICDLVRNDLSKIAKSGTVHVPELLGIHRFESVHQMISTVQCTLREEVTTEDILRATFPMGSMTGAPKIRAMEIIDELEAGRRGVYSGSIGFIKPNGDFDFNVVIRSLLYNAATPRISMHVGGAITSLSDPTSEYAECLLKAEAMMQTLTPHVE